MDKQFTRTLTTYQAHSIKRLAIMLHRLGAVKSLRKVKFTTRNIGQPGYGDEFTIVYRYEDVL